MTDKLQRDVERGSHAQRLAEDPLLKECFNILEQSIIMGWRSSKNVAERAEAWYELRAMDRVRALLTKIAQDGKVAAGDIERLRKKDRDPMRRPLGEDIARVPRTVV